MIVISKFVASRKKIFLWLVFVLAAMALSGCQTMRYYRQAIAGQYRIVTSRQSIHKLRV